MNEKNQPNHGGVIDKILMGLGIIYLLAITPLPFFNDFVKLTLNFMLDLFPIELILISSGTLVFGVQAIIALLILLIFLFAVFFLIFSFLKIRILDGVLVWFAEKIHENDKKERSKTITEIKNSNKHKLNAWINNFYASMNAQFVNIVYATILGVAYFQVSPLFFEPKIIDSSGISGIAKQVLGKEYASILACILGVYLLICGARAHSRRLDEWLGKKPQ
ncbi:MAG: hypothetical protein ABH803_04570 [Candidatus Micrarchaeota archaeon]